MKIITWNTGRPYGRKGQRIAATQLPDGRVMLCDVDRHIEYVTSDPCELSQEPVMAAYDSNRADFPDHDPDTRAMLQTLRTIALAA
jgi:hypothetical protein